MKILISLVFAVGILLIMVGLIGLVSWLMEKYPIFFMVIFSILAVLGMTLMVTIDHVNKKIYTIKEYGFAWTDEMFECIEKPSREDFLKMPVGTKIITDKGKELVYDGECFSDKDDVIIDTMIDDDLNLIYDDMDYGTKIIEILEPEYRTVWKEEVKKMTLKEIEEKLGYEIELVEE